MDKVLMNNAAYVPGFLIRFCIMICQNWLRNTEKTEKRTVLRTPWFMVKAEVQSAGKIVSIHYRIKKGAVKMWHYERYQIYTDRDPFTGKWCKPYAHFLRGGNYPYNWTK